MPAWAHFTLLCAAVCAGQSSSLSCENANAIPQNGASLLQLGRTSKSLNGAANEAAEFTEIEPVIAAGYEATKKKCCLKAMAEFINDLAISMGYKICNSGFGPGLAVWHTCKGNGATSTFENLKNEITDYTKDPCSATIGNNNLAGVGPDSGKQEIAFIGIGSTGSPAVPFNMIVTAVGGNYETSNPGYNGLRKTDKYTAGAISMSAGHSIDVKFEFQLADGTPVKLPEFHFTLWDIDGNSMTQEYVTMEGFTDYVIDNITDVKVTDEDTNAKVATFSTKPANNAGDVSVSGTVLVLSAEARKAAVMMIYKDVSEFKMTFRKSGANSGSMVVFNGACSLEDHCRA